jgi:glycine/D-amino acid oxidase-like deaminating enzyme
MKKRRWTRRQVLERGGMLLASAGLSGAGHAQSKPRILVVGAGAFGGWTALSLLRKGARVTLLDAWGPGNSRASSGGDTRVIRATYGPQKIYVDMVARALELWRENELLWGRKLLFPCGALRLTKDESYGKAAVPLLRGAGLRVEELTPNELANRYPQLNLEGVGQGLLEQDAGYLLARRACQAVLESFLAEGGQYRQKAVEPTELEEGMPQGLFLTDGTYALADQFVFACGPWLPELFPRTIGPRIRPNRQEVFFFGALAGDPRFTEEEMPCFLDGAHSPSFYGIPGNEHRGFKVAGGMEDASTFDPTNGDRRASREQERVVRRYLDFRFPAMKGAPLVESRVCQYESTPDSDLILDRHPRADHVWILGGGSGHGFKHGPALGERAAAIVLGERRTDPEFSLSRMKIASFP